MGGRSATSGISTFGKKSGTRLTPKQYKEAVSAQANFIFRELNTSPALQNIIRKSFKGNTTEVTFITEGSKYATHSSFISELDRFNTQLSEELAEQKREKKSSGTWSAYDVARAKEQALKQVIDEIEKMKKKIK